MKDYEWMPSIEEEMQKISWERERMIDIHSAAIKYHQNQIDDINSTTIEQEFYLGNSNFPDYPGNEWMTETYTCYHCDDPMLTTDTKPSDDELAKLVCSKCTDKMWG